MSPEMIEASPQNPDGGREDKQIFSLHQSLLRALHTTTYLPLPLGWQKEDVTKRIASQIGAIVDQRVEEAASKIWAIKDPNLSLFLPIWIRLFNAKKILPHHILCVRHPEAVARSMEAQYGQSRSMSMTMWLLRNCYTLVNTGGNCLVLHYEGWEQDILKQLRALCRFCGFTLRRSDKELMEKISAVYRPVLNRTGDSIDLREIDNPHVSRLYDALLAVGQGEMAGRAAVRVAQECLKQFEHFRGLSDSAQEAIQALSNQKKLAEQRAQTSVTSDNSLDSLKTDIDDVRKELRSLKAGLRLALKNEN